MPLTAFWNSGSIWTSASQGWRTHAYQVRSPSAAARCVHQEEVGTDELPSLRIWGTHVVKASHANFLLRCSCRGPTVSLH